MIDAVAEFTPLDLYISHGRYSTPVFILVFPILPRLSSVLNVRSSTPCFELQAVMGVFAGKLSTMVLICTGLPHRTKPRAPRIASWSFKKSFSGNATYP